MWFAYSNHVHRLQTNQINHYDIDVKAKWIFELLFFLSFLKVEMDDEVVLLYGMRLHSMQS